MNTATMNGAVLNTPPAAATYNGPTKFASTVAYAAGKPDPLYALVVPR